MNSNRFNGFENSLRSHIRKVAICILALLCILFIYVSYLQTYESRSLAEHPLNKRLTEASKRVLTGQILDRNNNKLAYSERSENGQQRNYPFGPVTAHIVGYNSDKYGKSGMEAAYAAYLTGLNTPLAQWGAIAQLFMPEQGDNVKLTLDVNLQKTAYSALGNHRGAVVVLNPRTGEILAMVSKPAFNPNSVEADWDNISHSKDSLLLNRATQGLYPPGSTIKVMIAESALREKIVDLAWTFNCDGALKIGPDYVLNEHDSQKHGKINLQQGLAVSCNTMFGSLTLKLGSKRLEETFDRYGFLKPLGQDLQETPSHLPEFSKLSDGDLAQTGIGQGSLLVTPLRMALLASSFANQGKLMKPFLVSQIQAADGSVRKTYSPETWLTPAAPEVADEIKNMMVTVVNEGTGGAAGLGGIQVAGKTGTAENPHGESHAWFIGFAPADNPEVAIAVIVENAGAGGQIAAPIARKILAQALR